MYSFEGVEARGEEVVVVGAEGAGEARESDWLELSHGVMSWLKPCRKFYSHYNILQFRIWGGCFHVSPGLAK